MIEVKRNWRTHCGLLASLGLFGCGPAPSTPDVEVADVPEFAVPALPARAPLETKRLGGNVYENICRLGNPFAVVGWDLDPHTRLVYFVGPFSGEGDQPVYPYLYMSITGPERARVKTTLHLKVLNAQDLRAHMKLGELRRFLLPQVAALDADPDSIRRLLGEPTHTRKLDSGGTRLIFQRDFCFDGKRLIGMYVDVVNGRLVKAKGVDHPERMKWIISGNRPPEPDDRATFYEDWHPRVGSVQEAALAFVFSLENGDLAGARDRVSTSDPPSQLLEEFARTFGDGLTIDTETLTYRTTRYELDFAEVTIAYTLSNARRVRADIQLRDAGKDHWRVSDWSVGANPP